MLFPTLPATAAEIASGWEDRLELDATHRKFRMQATRRRPKGRGDFSKHPNRRSTRSTRCRPSATTRSIASWDWCARWSAHSSRAGPPAPAGKEQDANDRVCRGPRNSTRATFKRSPTRLASILPRSRNMKRFASEHATNIDSTEKLLCRSRSRAQESRPATDVALAAGDGRRPAQAASARRSFRAGRRPAIFQIDRQAIARLDKRPTWMAIRTDWPIIAARSWSWTSGTAAAAGAFAPCRR